MEPFQDRVPLTHLFLTVVMEGLSSGSSQCEWAGIKQQIHSNIPISRALSLHLNHKEFLIFSQSAIFWFMFQTTKQILENFLTP